MRTTKQNHIKENYLIAKKHGGLNIKEAEAHNITIRVKHTLNLKKQENPLSWTYLPTCWLTKVIHNLSPEYNYLKDEN